MKSSKRSDYLPLEAITKPRNSKKIHTNENNNNDIIDKKCEINKNENNNSDNPNFNQILNNEQNYDYVNQIKSPIKGLPFYLNQLICYPNEEKRPYLSHF